MNDNVTIFIAQTFAARPFYGNRCAIGPGVAVGASAGFIFGAQRVAVDIIGHFTTNIANMARKPSQTSFCRNIGG